VDTIRVDIAYRPLRIGWAIRAGDIDAFRQAVRFSYTFWGGRFDPILVVDHEEEARRLVDLFRVDLILGVGDAEEVKAFPKGFAHLINPLLFDTPYVGGSGGAKASALDIHNMIVHLRDKPEWKVFKEQGLRVYTWQAEDPLADVFLVHFGAYPNAAAIGIDYRAMLTNATGAKEQTIEPSAGIATDILLTVA